MGKYLLEALPAILLAIIVVKGAVWWYRNKFGKIVKGVKQFRDSSKYYDSQLADEDEKQ